MSTFEFDQINGHLSPAVEASSLHVAYLFSMFHNLLEHGLQFLIE